LADDAEVAMTADAERAASRGPGPKTDPGPDARVWVLTAVMAVAGLVIGWVRPMAWTHQQLPLSIGWWPLALVFAAAEIFVVHYQFRRDRYTFSLVEVPLALGLFFATWPALVIGRLIGSAVALRFHRKQGLMKLSFNLAAFLLEASVAVTLFGVIVGNSAGDSPRALLSAMAAILSAVLLVTTCIAVVITVNEGRQDRRTVMRLFVANVVVAVTNASLALVAVAVLWVNKSAAWLLLAVSAILFVGYRSYARLQQKHDDLELLYDFTRSTGRTLHVDSAMRELLAQVRTALRADIAELHVQSVSGRTVSRTSLSGEDELTVKVADESPLCHRLAESSVPLLLADPPREAQAVLDLAELGMKDAMIAPLRRMDGSVFGLMLAGNRLGDQRTFTSEDLKLFEALANHAAVSLENRHLIERLWAEVADREHQALHDALTGLPNRLLFQRRIAAALANGDVGSSVAVMLLDLDRFKEVNDTLGHHNGDLLLQEIGNRLRRILRSGDTVARLGGDEFAVLLPDLAGDEAALAAATGIRQALERPFEIAEVNLDVGCSVGIAMWPQHGEDETILLQRADVAMYSAKESRRGVELYDPTRDNYSLERLALVSELRAAIEQGDLAVHYQPKADIASGRLLGMEALVRWNHPRLGSVPPEEIIAVAEQTGLIRPLTLWVLDQALRQCRAWRRDGRAFDVAVNLSIRNLLDAELPNDVLRMLSELGLPSSALTFEITESSIMNDPVRTVAVLGRLRAMGVRLAIDDFGTGYSSFSHLQRMPVDEIKIDKSFVQHLATDDSDYVIVRSIVDLGRNLGLRVVAEGVEDRGAWERLRKLGCDIAQGYYLTRPLPAVELDAWLNAQPTEEAEPEGDVVPLRTTAFRRS
jgi:diguanylate cyclase (GGDEF)-like protein